MFKYSIFLFAFLVLGSASLLDAKVHKSDPVQVYVRSESKASINLEFEVVDYRTLLSENDFGSSPAFSTGKIVAENKPFLPAVSRIIVVPRDAGIELEVASKPPRKVKSESRPRLFSLDGENRKDHNLKSVYPAQLAKISDPFVIRGVRLVKLTTYPVRYDPNTEEYLIYEQIGAKLVYNDDKPVNPAKVPVRRNRSRQFLKFIRSLAVNGDIVGRDDPDNGQTPEYWGHYLIVAHENCLEFAAPFIEWRRKAGYKVDILSVPNEIARSQPDRTKRMIQDRYDAYLDEGIDPFDHILLIGDREHYYYTQEAQWILKPFRGDPTWGADDHADYLFACLEGGNNDRHPDVGVSRWHSGAENLMELAVGRTLAYEMEPYMEDLDWFTRGAAYSQHWGNSPASAWHVSIHTNARWGEEVLQAKGFERVYFYEDYDWDRRGERIGPVIEDWLNEGLNVMVGRAENYYWDGTPAGPGDFDQGVRENVIFPINLCHSGHGEWCAECMTRRGSGDNLKGPVAMTYGWGNPRYTAPISASWLECVNAVMFKDLTIGWGRIYGMTAIENYFDGGDAFILSNKTEFDCFGDPAIQPWIGAPQVVECEYPDRITIFDRIVEVAVADADGDAPVEGAHVTLYYPGDMPPFDDEDYADYDDMLMVTKRTGEDGTAKFVFDEDVELFPGVMYMTVSGRDVKPCLGEIDIDDQDNKIVLSEYNLTELNGNHDDNINPGERFSMVIAAQNVGDETIEDIHYLITSPSDWLALVRNHEAFYLGDLEAGESVALQDSVEIFIYSDCPDGSLNKQDRPMIFVDFSVEENDWRSAFEFDVHAPEFEVREIPGGNIIPDSLHSLDIDLANSGRIDSSPVTAELISRGMGVSVVQNTASFPEIEAGEHARLRNGERFLIRGNSLVPPGSITEMALVLTNQEDFADTAYFTLQISEPRENAPIGPDAYGYICLDDTDTDWAVAPEYEWIEISLRERERDYDGTLMDFDGRSELDVGESLILPLPFETQFYGQIYDTITVCTNGFIAFGDQRRITNFQNWPMDRAIGGGAGMAAPFWDWLEFEGNSGVYYYYNEDEGSLIIEWHRLNHYGEGEDLIFQVILYDRTVWITETGDQNILFQYKNIVQLEGEQGGQPWERHIPYASVGISSPKGDTGINYTFNNEYPINAARLENERAILFTTSPRYKSCMLYGLVRDYETRRGIVGAVVMTQQGFAAVTNHNGFYRIDGALAEIEFNITATAEGYNDSTKYGLEVAEDDSLGITFDLLHSSFELSQERLNAAFPAGERHDYELRIVNSGNGPLEWSAERQFPGEETGIGHRIRSHLFGPEVNDLGLEGVVYANGRFYVSGQNGQRPNLIYVFDSEGEYVRNFEQPGNSRIGMLDLTYGDSLLWGSGERNVYGFTTEGEVMYQFRGPFATNKAIAYDPEGFLWITTDNMPIIGVDNTGARVTAIDSHYPLVSGLACYPEDPDGFYLYAIESVNGDIMPVHKFDPATGDTMFVATLNTGETGEAGGIAIADGFRPFGTVFLVLVNDYLNDIGDRSEIWQIGTYTGWLDLNPYQGMVEPESEYAMNVTLDANGLFTAMYEADLIFNHSASRNPVVFEVLLEVQHPNFSGGLDSETPLEFGLDSVYPQPFNHNLQIHYNLDRAGWIELAIYDLQGRKIHSITEDYFEKGLHKLNWNAENRPNGMYILSLMSDYGRDVQKVLFVK